MFVKPAPDPNRPGEVLIVRDPQTMVPIPAKGRYLPDTDLYWHQRLLQGDIIPAEPLAEVVAEAPAEVA